MKRTLAQIESNSQNFTVTICSDGQQAIDFADQNSSIVGGIDLVLLDLNMPGIDGYEVLATWKNDNIFQDTPIIVVTTATDKTMLQSALDIGASAVHSKPAGLAELKTLFETILVKWSDFELT